MNPTWHEMYTLREWGESSRILFQKKINLKKENVGIIYRAVILFLTKWNDAVREMEGR